MATFIVALALAASVPTAYSQVNLSATPEAYALINRTHTTQATYSLVSSNELHPDSGTVNEFSAEFNRGDWHRVETPRDRIVANCRTGWSAHLNIATGEISHSDGLADAACGIYTGDLIRTAEVTGSRASQFGRLQQLRIVTYGATRTYEVASNGAIVSETISDLNDKLRLKMQAVSLSDKLPSDDIFSEGSLAKSAVPEATRNQLAGTRP